VTGSGTGELVPFVRLLSVFALLRKRIGGMTVGVLSAASISAFIACGGTELVQFIIIAVGNNQNTSTYLSPFI